MTEHNSLEHYRRQVAWENATPFVDGREFRIDCDGRFIRWSEYGLYSTYGWQIDHIRPTALGGNDMLGNLRARHWEGNCSAGGVLGNAMANMGRKTG
jgi:hypothetical protein